MKICYIANSGNSHTDKWVKPFVDKGHEVHIISHSKREIEGTILHYIDFSMKNFLWKVRRVHKKIKEIDPDILHAQQVNTCGLYAATMKGYNLFSSGWGSDVLYAPFQSRLMNAVVKYVVSHSVVITSGADYMTEVLIHKLGATPDQVLKIPLGVFEEIFDHRHVYEDSPKIDFVSVRRHEPIYNMDILIKGFYEAQKQNSNITLTIAASGSLTNMLQNMVTELGIEDKVVFTGKYHAEEIGGILEKFDALIAIPKSDSTSVSLLEGMAVGIFPILANLPPNKEWVKDKENGIILAETNVENVRDAILWCTENKQKLKLASQYNVELVKKNAVWTDSVRAVERLYEKYRKDRNK